MEVAVRKQETGRSDSGSTTSTLEPGTEVDARVSPGWLLEQRAIAADEVVAADIGDRQRLLPVEIALDQRTQRIIEFACMV